MKYFFTLLTLAICSTTFGQNINFNEKSELRLNQQLIDHTTTLSDIVKLLGEPELIKENKNGKKQYIYSKHGLAIHTLNDKLILLGVNYNWDCDKTFPETSYPGGLTIAKVHINKNCTATIMSEINFLTFHNVFEGLFVAATPGTNIAVMVGFKNDLITQIGFEFKP